MGFDSFPNTYAQEAVIAHRRELVARARLRGASIREIAAALVAIGFVNPVTYEPWSHQTICNDLQALEAEWQANAKQAIEEHKANQLAELREVRRQAWHDKDMASVLRAINMEMTLLGTEAQKTQDNLNFNVDMSHLPDEVIEKMARGEKVDLAAIAGASRTGKT